MSHEREARAEEPEDGSRLPMIRNMQEVEAAWNARPTANRIEEREAAAYLSSRTREVMSVAIRSRARLWATVFSEGPGPEMIDEVPIDRSGHEWMSKEDFSSKPPVPEPPPVPTEYEVFADVSLIQRTMGKGPAVEFSRNLLAFIRDDLIKRGYQVERHPRQIADAVAVGKLPALQMTFSVDATGITPEKFREDLHAAYAAWAAIHEQALAVQPGHMRMLLEREVKTRLERFKGQTLDEERFKQLVNEVADLAAAKRSAGKTRS